MHIVLFLRQWLPVGSAPIACARLTLSLTMGFWRNGEAGTGWRAGAKARWPTAAAPVTAPQVSRRAGAPASRSWIPPSGASSVVTGQRRAVTGRQVPGLLKSSADQRRWQVGTSSAVIMGLRQSADLGSRACSCSALKRQNSRHASAGHHATLAGRGVRCPCSRKSSCGFLSYGAGIPYRRGSASPRGLFRVD
jgi:hypothetical protein